MTYRLRLDPTVHAIYAGLPEPARADIALCLLDAMTDPYVSSMPYGIDDGVMRTLARGHVALVVLVDTPNKTITVVHLTYAG